MAHLKLETGKKVKVNVKVGETDRHGNVKSLTITPAKKFVGNVLAVVVGGAEFPFEQRPSSIIPGVLSTEVRDLDGFIVNFNL